MWKFVVSALAGNIRLPPKGGTTNGVVYFLWRLVLLSLCLTISAPRAIADEFTLSKDDTVVFLGGTNMLSMQRAGYLEAMLTQAFATERPRFRDLSWEADTVFQQGTATERWRAKAHFDDDKGLGDLAEQLENLEATVVVAQFGKLESMTGETELDEFTEAYRKLLDQLKANSRRVLLLSPIPFEKTSNQHLPDLSQRNGDLAKYVAATRQLAEKHDIHFADLFTDAPAGLTSENGMHLKPEAQLRVADQIGKQLGIANTKSTPKLRQAIIEKHRLWYDYWRPANWKLLFGDDARREFTRGDTPFRDEWKRLLPMIARAEERVWTIANSGDAPVHERPKPEVLHADPTADIEEELASFTVPDGFQVNLFASEADGLTSPLSLRWDPAGRMYVTVTTTYPHVFPGDVPNDKIIRLEDTNRDGKADRSVVFAEGLNIPTGMEWGHGGVYVGQNTEILFLEDTDEDGKADKRRVLLSGFGNGDSHQTINSFRWSPDGQLYFGHGDGCESRVETPWGASNLFNAGYYRLEPNRLKLTPFLEGHMGPGNPWGVAYDAWGQIFGVDGAGGVSWLTPGQVETTHRRRFPRIGKPGGYCGIGYLDGRGLPELMQGDFAIGDYKPNQVSRFSLEDDGAGFKLNWEEPILKSRHRNFRPVDVQVGPDGAIYVVDWYNPITCHQDDAFRHPERDKAHGRIWRVSMIQPTTDDPIHPPNLLRATIPELLDSLQSSEYWTRYQAKRALTTRDWHDLVVPLQKWEESLDPRDKNYDSDLFQILSTCATNEVVDIGIVARALVSSNPRVRAFATRMVGRWHDRLNEPLALLRDSVTDKHPRVRLEGVLACSQIASADALDLASRVVDLPMDSWIDYTFKQTVHRLKRYWLPAFKRGQVRMLDTEPLSAILNEIGGNEVIDALKRLIDDGDLAETNNESRAAAMAAILAVGSPEDLSRYGLAKRHFTDQYSYHSSLHGRVLARLVEFAKVRDVRPSGTFAKQLRELMEEKNVDVRAAATELAGIWKVKELHDKVSAFAANEQTPDTIRAAALLAMGAYATPESTSALKEHARTLKLPKLRVPAIKALATVDMSSAAEVAATYLCGDDPFLHTDEKAQERLLTAFLSRPTGASTLTAAIQAQSLAAENAQQVIRALFATGRSEPQLFSVLHAALGATSKPPPYSSSLVKQLAKSAALHGDSKRGVTVFRSLSCTSCHHVSGLAVGQESSASVGPELTSLGTTLSPERIIEEVLWPNRQIKEGFATIVVLTADGKLETGYQRVTKRSEKAGDILLQDLKTQKLTTIKKDDIEEKRMAPSAMPEGLTSILSDEQLFDLIRYLTELGKTK